ncbi:UNVERIFIED_CONTAM: hypothetical protein Sradi_2278200 [Sesamum radiatum]|uniref:Uncharacterized protein n=1 Tax=Sesamum radiatum TaxID=300843 RepID=A0AAW2T4I9_SESRA
MAAWTAAARQAANLARLSTPRTAATSAQASVLIQRRGLAGGGDHHGPPKVNFWQDPMSPSKWKEEHLSNCKLEAVHNVRGWWLYYMNEKGK